MPKGSLTKRLLIISPAPPGGGGIGTWVGIITDELKTSKDIQVQILDTTPRWRHPTDLRVGVRLVGGSLQALRDISRFFLASVVLPATVYSFEYQFFIGQRQGSYHSGVL